MEDLYVPILMYHSISSSTNPLFKRWAVPPELFDAHLSYLKQQRYTPITVTDLVQARVRRGEAALPARPVVLTFDDAYADFYDAAFPALQRYGFVATLYIPTAYIGGTCGWMRREGEAERPMANWRQLAEISAGGVECGGHGHVHMQMDALPSSAAADEIRSSKTIIEEHLGREVLSFAYPHGWTTSSIKRMVQAAGYSSACAVKNMPSSAADDPFELPRLVVAGDASEDTFARLLTHRPAPIEVALRNIARPMWRFVPRHTAWLKGHIPAGSGVRQEEALSRPSGTL